MKKAYFPTALIIYIGQIVCFFFKIAKTLKSFSLIKFFPNKFFQIKLISN